ncbi:MAG: NADH:flavin oxidoreductase [Chloroflexota bacterium]|nr:MAG: NADH:flavin oxidoreductase [Chloroflexota bacterium]
MTAQNLKALFTPITIKGMEIKNRVVMAPLQLSLGFRSQRTKAFYLERASGGTGAITLAATAVDILASEEAWGKSGALDAFLKGLSSLVADIHTAGARVGIQLWHGFNFPAGLSGVEGELIAPSPTGDTRELKAAEIKVIVGKFATAAANAKGAGLDFVNIHGAHAYLLHRFFSPLDNQRSDKYVGSVEKRMTFALECLKAVRKAVGEDYPLFWRLSSEEGVVGGITLDNSIKLAKALEKAGIDVIDVSYGRFARQIMPSKKMPMGTYVSQAEAIKKAVNVPVIAVGRINSPQLAAEIVSQNKADLVALGRQLITDPYWVKKAQEGRFSDIVLCDSCNRNCVRSIPENRKRTGSEDLSLCKVNERAGREWLM